MGESERCRHALQAAAAVARRLGAGGGEPRLLMDANNVSVSLDALRVVARVFSAGPFGADMAAIGREVAIARHLADRGAPIVRPTTDLPAGPHLVGDLAVTLWEFVPHRPAIEADVNQGAAALRSVHAALADFPDALPTLEGQFAKVRIVLEDPSAMPSLGARERAFLLGAHDAIMARLAVLTSRPCPTHGPTHGLTPGPTHGDAHLGNVLMTDDGPRWTDFEAACIAPREWDFSLLAGADPSVIGPIDPAVARVMSDLRSLGVTAWCWGRQDDAAQREAADYHLDRLKGRAAAGFR